MANSYIEYTSGLTETTYSIPFKYISVDDVLVKGFDGSSWSDLTVASRSDADKTVTLDTAPSAYQKIRVWRNTSTAQLVDFQNGSRLSERDLDTAYQQGLFVAQEVSENASTEVEGIGPQGPQGIQGVAGADPFDDDGNLLVSATTTSGFQSSSSVSGSILYAAGGIASNSPSNDVAAVFNRLGTDGNIVQLKKDGSTVGTIGVQARMYMAGTAMGIYFGPSYLAPTNSSGTVTDNTYDLGDPSYRWDDIYATNGTIQTSDANEKQDIEVLSEAEQRVAVACKGLLRKFRWKSSVGENGDDARIHFGIIAQDLKAAFEAEGLDAGRYAMFTSSTWTDEDSGEEKTRLGVRYSELLAFIISAI